MEHLTAKQLEYSGNLQNLFACPRLEHITKSNITTHLEGCISMTLLGNPVGTASNRGGNSGISGRCSWQAKQLNLHNARIARGAPKMEALL